MARRSTALPASAAPRRGEIPLVADQAGLFTDEGTHPDPVVHALASYYTHAVIHGESPVGLPPLQILSVGKSTPAERQDLTAELHRLAWLAVLEHPLSGLKPR